MHDNKFTNYKVPSGLMILFLEKALTLIHMETHLNDVSEIRLIIGHLLLDNHSSDLLLAF
jgi:hypothetical protein